MRKPIIFIPNKGGHNYSSAERYGKLRFVTEGAVKRFATDTMYRIFVEAMADAREEDYLLITSLSILNAIAASILARRFGRVNFLLFNDGRYLERTVMFDALLDDVEGPEEKEISDEGH